MEATEIKEYLHLLKIGYYQLLTELAISFSIFSGGFVPVNFVFDISNLF